MTGRKQRRRPRPAEAWPVSPSPLVTRAAERVSGRSPCGRPRPRFPCRPGLLRCGLTPRGLGSPINRPRCAAVRPMARAATTKVSTAPISARPLPTPIPYPAVPPAQGYRWRGRPRGAGPPRTGADTRPEVGLGCTCVLTDLPNLLTLSRIAAIPLLVVLVALRTPAATWRPASCSGRPPSPIISTASWPASRRQLSDLGRMLDPIADKLLVGAALMMLVGLDRLSAYGLYPAIVIMLREILVSGLREYLAGIRSACRSPASPSGRPASRWAPRAPCWPGTRRPLCCTWLGAGVGHR